MSPISWPCLSWHSTRVRLKCPGAKYVAAADIHEAHQPDGAEVWTPWESLRALIPELAQPRSPMDSRMARWLRIQTRRGMAWVVPTPWSTIRRSAGLAGWRY